VANDRSIAWGITQALSQAGARIALTYQGDRLKERVENLAATMEGSLTLPWTPPTTNRSPRCSNR